MKNEDLKKFTVENFNSKNYPKDTKDSKFKFATIPISLLYGKLSDSEIVTLIKLNQLDVLKDHGKSREITPNIIKKLYNIDKNVNTIKFALDGLIEKKIIQINSNKVITLNYKIIVDKYNPIMELKINEMNKTKSFLEKDSIEKDKIIIENNNDKIKLLKQIIDLGGASDEQKQEYNDLIDNNPIHNEEQQKDNKVDSTPSETIPERSNEETLIPKERKKPTEELLKELDNKVEETKTKPLNLDDEHKNNTFKEKELEQKNIEIVGEKINQGLEDNKERDNIGKGVKKIIKIIKENNEIVTWNLIQHLTNYNDNQINKVKHYFKNYVSIDENDIKHNNELIQQNKSKNDLIENNPIHNEEQQKDNKVDPTPSETIPEKSEEETLIPKEIKSTEELEQKKTQIIKINNQSNVREYNLIEEIFNNFIVESINNGTKDNLNINILLSRTNLNKKEVEILKKKKEKIFESYNLN